MRWLQNRKNTLYRMGIAAAALVLVGLIWAGAGLYRQRKATEAEIAARAYTSQTVRQQETAPVFSQDIVEYKGKRYRRNTYVKAILCMGVDRAGTMAEKTTHGFGGQADGLFLIAQDTARNTLKILMIPRDTMTDITFTDLSGNVLGKGVQHLNLAYAYGDGREQSCKYMTEAVSDLLKGLKIDWYLAADMDAIPILNDQVGGVPVTVRTEGMEARDPALIKGAAVTLKGKQAEIFVRFRDIKVGHSALFRMNQQQQYIESFFATVKNKSEGDSGLVIRLFGLVQNYMITNMDKDQYLKIAMDALGSGKLEDKDFYTVPGKSVITPRYDEFYADREGMTQVILELFYRETT